jgi:hypothetical protein
VYCKLERVMNCRGRSRSYGCMSETESRTRRERRGLGLRRTSPHAVTPDSGQRRHELPQVFNAVRWIVRAGAPWRVLPNDFPPLGGRLPADPALAGGQWLRSDGARLTGAFAPGL